MTIIEKLAGLRQHRFAVQAMAVLGVDIPKDVQIGRGFRLMHRGQGVVIHHKTIIGDRVRVFHQVTIGRQDAHVSEAKTNFGHVVIEDDVVLFAGAKVLGGPGVTTVGAGTMVAANAVLLCSTGENEIWGGIPARKIGDRDPSIGSLV